VKTQQVTRNRGQLCGDIELTGYLANESGPVSLVVDLRIVQESSGVVLTSVFMDTYITLMNNPPNVISFMTLLVRLGDYIMNL
jgi:hypothetical protein